MAIRRPEEVVFGLQCFFFYGFVAQAILAKLQAHRLVLIITEVGEI